MLLEIFTIILMGITAVAEYYLFGVADVMNQHGIGFIFGLSLAVILPILCVSGIIMSVKKYLGKDQEEELPVNLEDTSDGRTMQEIACDSLKAIAAGKKSLAVDSRKAYEQVGRFEKKYESLMNCNQSNGKLSAVLLGCKSVFYKRTNEFIQVAASFDDNEYRQFKAGELELKDPALIQRKDKIYKNIFSNLDKITDDNEELILRLDELIQAVNSQQNNSEWDTETLLTFDRIGDYLNKVDAEVKLDKDISKSAAEAFKDIYNMNSQEDDGKIVLKH